MALNIVKKISNIFGLSMVALMGSSMAIVFAAEDAQFEMELAETPYLAHLSASAPASVKVQGTERKATAAIPIPGAKLSQSMPEIPQKPFYLSQSMPDVESSFVVGSYKKPVVSILANESIFNKYCPPVSSPPVSTSTVSTSTVISSKTNPTPPVNTPDEEVFLWELETSSSDEEDN